MKNCNRIVLARLALADTSRSYMLLDDLFDEPRDVLLKFHGSPFQSVVNGDFVPGPHDIYATRLSHCYMLIILREGPITSPTHVHISQLLPVDTMLTRPRFGTIGRSTQQHVYFGIVSVSGIVTGYFKRDPMIDLKFLWIELLLIDGATASM